MLKRPFVRARKTQLKFANFTVPNAGQLPMRCGKCGGNEYFAHVLPDLESGSGRVMELVCTNGKCRKSYRLDDFGRLGGDMTPVKARSNVLLPN